MGGTCNPAGDVKRSCVDRTQGLSEGYFIQRLLRMSMERTEASPFLRSGAHPKPLRRNLKSPPGDSLQGIPRARRALVGGRLQVLAERASPNGSSLKQS